MSKGDCYEVAGNIALRGSDKIPKRNEFGILKDSNESYSGTPYLVHAQVEGQGALQGVKYGHAFIEDNIWVYDFSNGRSIRLPKDTYYYVGNIRRDAPIFFKYTFEQARQKMAKTGHYGSWDLITESGL